MLETDLEAWDLTLAEAGALLKLHPSTLVRWVTTGIRCGTGMLRLDARRFGIQWRTNKQAITTFIDKLTAQRD